MSSEVDMKDTVTVSEFVRNTKVFLNTAEKNPVYIRRGTELFRVTYLPAKFVMQEDTPKPVTVMGTPADTWVPQDAVPQAEELPKTYTPEQAAEIERIAALVREPAQTKVKLEPQYGPDEDDIDYNDLDNRF